MGGVCGHDGKGIEREGLMSRKEGRIKGRTRIRVGGETQMKGREEG